MARKSGAAIPATPRVCASVVPSHSARQAVEILAEARACLRWHPLCTYVIDILLTNYRSESTAKEKAIGPREKRDRIPEPT